MWSRVVRRPLSVRLSVCPSVVNFSHFRLLLWNHWTEFNETWQEARSQRPLPSLCFSGRSEKQDGCPGLWLAETFSTSPLKPLNVIQRNLTGSKISTSSTKFVFFGPIRKTRWPSWSLIGWDIFDFSSETAEWNSTKLDRKQDLNVLYHVCVFQVDRKNKMAALASDWLRYFRLLLWNRWTEFKETWQEARSQRPLPSLCFSGRSEKQDGRPGLWLAGTFSTFSLKPLNGIQRNMTGSKISTSSTKFVFFRPMSKQKFPPWLICQKAGTLYSGARYVALWASCFFFLLLLFVFFLIFFFLFFFYFYFLIFLLLLLFFIYLFIIFFLKKRFEILISWKIVPAGGICPVSRGVTIRTSHDSICIENFGCDTILFDTIHICTVKRYRLVIKLYMSPPSSYIASAILKYMFWFNTQC